MKSLLRKALVSVPQSLRPPIRMLLTGFLGGVSGFAVVKVFPSPWVYAPLCVVVGLAVGLGLAVLGVRWERMEADR